MILRADGVTRDINYGLTGLVSKSVPRERKNPTMVYFFSVVAPGAETQNATRGKKKVLERIVLN